MNWLMVAGGAAGVCLFAAFVWLVISSTYDEAYRQGFADGRDFAHFGEMRPRKKGVINSPKVINSPSENFERKGK